MKTEVGYELEILCIYTLQNEKSYKHNEHSKSNHLTFRTQISSLIIASPEGIIVDLLIT